MKPNEPSRTALTIVRQRDAHRVDGTDHEDAYAENHRRRGSGPADEARPAVCRGAADRPLDERRPAILVPQDGIGEPKDGDVAAKYCLFGASLYKSNSQAPRADDGHSQL
jgi:hypothetical protein